jgi:hypothetical protein
MERADTTGPVFYGSLACGLLLLLSLALFK